MAGHGYDPDRRIGTVESTGRHSTVRRALRVPLSQGRQHLGRHGLRLLPWGEWHRHQSLSSNSGRLTRSHRHEKVDILGNNLVAYMKRFHGRCTMTMAPRTTGLTRTYHFPMTKDGPYSKFISKK